MSYDPLERVWLNWIDEVDRLFGGIDIDGDQETDGYSLDGFYVLWKRGLTPQQAINEIGDVEL